jgi:hypothetical protein
MSQIQFERKWIAQCEAARRVKERFGLFNALDYLIGEKWLTFAKTAESRTEFAQELPEFVHEIREVFSLHETLEYVAQLERSKRLSPLQRHALKAIFSGSAHIH